MELTNEFEVRAGVEDAWRLLTDVERIAPCLPDAELREIEGEEYRGVVRVKVGTITAEYRGSVHFVELDAEARRAVLRAEGKEARGRGNAAATITAHLEPSSTGTRVSVVTELSVSGKVAQFGRAALADASAALLGQFAENLEATVLHAERAHAVPPAAGRGESRRRSRPAPADDAPSSNGRSAEEYAGVPSSNGTGRHHEPEHVEPFETIDVGGSSILGRIFPYLAAIAGAALAAALLRRLRR